MCKQVSSVTMSIDICSLELRLHFLKPPLLSTTGVNKHEWTDGPLAAGVWGLTFSLALLGLRGSKVQLAVA